MDNGTVNTSSVQYAGIKTEMLLLSSVVSPFVGHINHQLEAML